MTLTTRPTRASTNTPATGAAAGAAAAEDGLTALDFDFLRELVLRRSAIVLDDGKGYLLESRLQPIVRQEGMGSFAQLVSVLRRSPRSSLEARVVDAMTTNETSFFRDVHPFDSMVELLSASPGGSSLTGQIHIWCAAASSGQEPYSIAMTLLEKAPELARRTRILATDLSPTMVQRCREGRYSQLEVNRGMPARYLVKHFEQDGTEWVARPELRSMVDTRTANLAEPFPAIPRCDLVMLRNVLIYFSVDTKAEILGRIRRNVLKPGGVLMLGGSETTHNIDDGYERIEFGRTSCYRPRTA